MKKINLLSLLIVLLISLISCNESTVNEPKDEDYKKFDINLLTKNVWHLNEITPPNGGYYWVPKYKFNKDFTLRAYINNSWVKGTWTIIEVETLPVKQSLKITFESNSLINSTDFIISSMSNNELQLNSDNNGYKNILTKYVAEFMSTTEIEIEGEILFDPQFITQDEQSLDSAKLCIVWVNPNDENSNIIYGQGTVDKNTKKCKVKVDNTFPYDLFIYPKTGIKGYFNVGYIMLLWGNGEELKNGSLLDIYKLKSSKVGMVTNRAFVYIVGNHKEWDIRKDLLIGNLQQGFNLCEHFAAIPSDKSSFIVTQNNSLQPVLVRNKLKDFESLIANWK